jgi:uncharacterized repeat protein (TIGR01451 family)
MLENMKKGIASLIVALFLFVVLSGFASAIAPEVTLEVKKVATGDSPGALPPLPASIAEIGAGKEFYYVIEVANKGDTDAINVVVTDKLPIEVTDITVENIDPDHYTMHGDLLYVNIDIIPAGEASVSSILKCRKE